MPFQPDKINREHVLRAFKEIDSGEIGVRQSTKFDILHEGKTYPPKDVMRLAHEYATGEYLWLPGGGEPTNKYLKNLQFKIVNKTVNELVNVKNDFAKWLLNNAPDSYNQYLGSSVQSIIERLDEIGTFFPDYKFFEIDPKTVTAKIKDIRLIFSTKERRKNLEFVQYDKFHSNGIPKAVLGKNHYLRYLKERFSESNSEIGYWLFQGNPKIFDFASAIGNNTLQNFTVSSHKDKIKIGDKVIIWLSGENAGCYALAEIIHEPRVVEVSVDDAHWKIEQPTDIKAGIRITHNFYNNPILKYKVAQNLKLKDLKLGLQGTNFSATKNEYQELLSMSENNNYTWVQTHKGLVDYLKNYKNKQPELIELLKSVGCEIFNDKDAIDSTVDLEVIDPFTFFCYIYKYGDVRRLEILQAIATKLNLHYPEDERGIPSANAQKVWMFPWKYQRVNNEIDTLWKLFYEVTDNEILESTFQDALKIQNVGKTKITEALFYVDPEYYFPINGPTKPYLKTVFGIATDFNSYSEYMTILNQLKQKTKKPFYQISYEAWLWNKGTVAEPTSSYKTEKQMKTTNLNTILFGPPGTGKTYNTINEALKIVDPEFYKANEDNREALNTRFKQLLIKKWDETKGQIAFCTFHQSFSYEDFVEGIKPKVNDNKEVFYKIENGVFKNICELADSNLSTLKVKKEGKLSWDEEQFRRASFYKLSLGNSQNSEDNEIYEYCRDNNYIAIGFGQGLDYSDLGETEVKEKFEETGQSETDAQQFNYFKNYLKVGNYVLISNGNKYVRALGKVTGDYEYDPNAPIRYNHFRNVDWIFKDENIPIEEIYEKGLSQRTIYKINENKLRPEFFINKGQLIENNEPIEKDYVLIIDEINRGNVSSIFGELITLIENDKRAGKDEELEVILPYSKQPFKVPHNVHLIGTMNTADKSIEALDTALRRRFSFTEMPPKPKLIETESLSGKVNGLVDGINLKDLLNIINKRIEKLIDKDHTIGHSYFLKVNDKSSLIHCFKNEVIPLLEEYFFGDYGKIGLVLGGSFITKDDSDDFEFAEFEGYDADISSDLKERSVYKIAKSKDWDFNTI
ncbi:EVE domain-containing protein [Winogradskyella echinorum]|uniref:EVE domain-containing protein n=1 Tax=Winogradskyella echinorum TaxID=538189 RepID=A0ABR6Y654_9FLAO|nr:AAA family ATPase [Winogradskyella echinorum]MBC3847728.1 EVE domain-containing protein [Winogradskyella echinorum]MBC5752076.1 EVE domain-containing protein [Winogradskyella echinorum]